MLKYYDVAIAFSEFPDEIALCLNISNCPCHCSQCSEPWLKEDIGTELTTEEILRLLKANPHCTVLGLMGGDADHEDIIRIINVIHAHSNIKVGFYSGLDVIDMRIASCVDFYKIGRWIAPTGDPKDWYRHSCGPLAFPFSNQRYFERRGDQLYDATEKFRKAPLNDLQRYIVTEK